MSYCTVRITLTRIIISPTFHHHICILCTVPYRSKYIITDLICLSVCLSVCLSIYVCLSVYPCLPVFLPCLFQINSVKCSRKSKKKKKKAVCLEQRIDGGSDEYRVTVVLDGLVQVCRKMYNMLWNTYCTVVGHASQCALLLSLTPPPPPTLSQCCFCGCPVGQALRL